MMRYCLVPELKDFARYDTYTRRNIVASEHHSWFGYYAWNAPWGTVAKAKALFDYGALSEWVSHEL